MTSPALEVRPVRPSDRDRVLELPGALADPDREEELAARFDDWVATPAGLFEAAELDGEVVGVLRLRPVARATLLLEGLLVDAQRRRTGIATALLGRALAQAREQGARQVRMAGADDAFARLATQVGFRSAVDARRWRASRLEGEEPARLGGREEAEGLLRMVAETPGFTAYARRLAGPDEGRDLDATTLRERAERGLVRVGPGGRALAVLLDGEDRVQVGFLGGQETPLRTLAEQLRFEADLHDVSEVSLWLPEAHPAAPVLEGAGYRRDAAPRLALYHLDLTNGRAQ